MADGQCWEVFQPPIWKVMTPAPRFSLSYQSGADGWCIFFRNVLTSLLRMQDRTDWKACAQSDEDDTLDAQNFKTAFAPFDDMLE